MVKCNIGDVYLTIISGCTYCIVTLFYKTLESTKNKRSKRADVYFSFQPLEAHQIFGGSNS